MLNTTLRLTCLATIFAPCFVAAMCADLVGLHCHTCERVVHWTMNGR